MIYEFLRLFALWEERPGFAAARSVLPGLHDELGVGYHVRQQSSCKDHA